MASTFPADTPSYDPFSTPITLAALQHTLRHRQMEEDIVAIATKVGETNSVDPTSHDYKIDVLEDDVAALQLDKADSTDVTSEIAAAIAAVKEALYPVGSIYTNAAVDTNPATLLGFGTWSAYAAGRVLVGVDTGQTEFDILEETGGAKTHTLSVAEMPAHDHSGKVYGTSNGDYMGLVGGGQGGWGVAGSTNNNIYRTLIQSQGGGGAHNNLQPYITVYMWKRTA